MKKIILVPILIATLLAAGCAEKGIVQEISEETAAAEKVPESEEIVYTTSADFVKAFVDLWKAEEYEKTYPMFVSTLTSKLPKERFAYLFSRDFKNIKSIEQTYYAEKDASTAKFSVLVKFDDGSSKRISLLEVLKKDNGWKMNDLKQYFEPLEYCGTTLNKDGCVYDYANEFKEEEWCKSAGVQFKNCYDSLGVELTIAQIKEVCSKYSTAVATQAECYKLLAYEENNDFYCSTIQIAVKRYECYGNVAAKNSKIGECETLRLAQDMAERTKAYSYCIAGYVEKTGDASTCDMITVTDTNSKEGKEACLAYS